VFFNKPAASHIAIPPLIVNCVHGFAVCNSKKELPVWLTPKNMSQSTSFVIYDPDGSLREQYGRQFRRNGYRVKTFNPANFEKSARYNPFEYARNEMNIPRLVSAVINGTKGRGKRGDLIFLSLESALLTALIGYVVEKAPILERNISSVMEMLAVMDPPDIDPYDDCKHTVDYMFKEIKENSPKSLYVRKYEFYKTISGRHAEAVINSCFSRLYPFGSFEAREYFSKDELCLNQSSNIKSALFVAPEKTDSFDFIVPLMYTQFFDILCEKGL
jgi:type IV secretion system protein VirD4